MPTLVRLILMALGIIIGVLLGIWGGPALFNLPVMIVAGISLYGAAVLVLRHKSEARTAPARATMQRMITGPEATD